MKKRKIIIPLIIIITLILIAYALYKIFSFSLFDIEKNSLAKVSLKDKDFIIDVSLVHTGATTEDIIQIKKVFNNGKEEVIRNYERYNYLISFVNLNDTTIQIVLNDTSYYKNKADTFKIVIP